MCEYRYGVCCAREFSDRDSRFVFHERDCSVSETSDRDGSVGESNEHVAVVLRPIFVTAASTSLAFTTARGGPMFATAACQSLAVIQNNSVGESSDRDHKFQRVWHLS